MQVVSASIVGKFWSKEVHLAGHALALRILTQALDGGEYPIRILLQREGITPKPYDHVLEDIVISETNGVVLLSIDHRTLAVCGSRQCLRILAENIAAVDGGDQSHLEYFPGNVYLSSSSVPLTVECVYAAAPRQRG